MGLLIFGILIGIIALMYTILSFVMKPPLPSKVVSPILVGIAIIVASGGAFSKNEAGYCTHIKTIFGQESSKCTYGWYFEGWGTSTSWPHYITVANTENPNAEGSSILEPLQVKMADNWEGGLIQSTRFGIPQEHKAFIKMASDFRTPQRLITSTLLPAVNSSADAVANFYSMEEYYTGGARDEFKTEFTETVKNGRAQVIREQVRETHSRGEGAAPSDNPDVRDTSVVDTKTVQYKTYKRKDLNGNDIRVPHSFEKYEITVASAIVEGLIPSPTFEDQIKKRKEAAARRSVAKEEKYEEQERKLLAIAQADRKIAERQGEAKVEQIAETTNAETRSKLALIEAERIRREAEIAKKSAQLELDRAEIDARAIKTLADAEAHKKKVILEADGALTLKGKLFIEANKVWADAFAKRNVPQIVMNSGASTGDSGDQATSNFINMKLLEAARNLSLDPKISNTIQ